MLTPWTKMQLAGLITVATLLAGCSKSVDSGAVSPIVTSEPPLEAVVGHEYTYAVTASGSPQPVITLEQAPAGMVLDSAINTITWVPESDSPYEAEVSVVVTNLRGRTSQTFAVQVAGLRVEGWETSGMVTERIDPVAIRAVADAIDVGTYPGIHSLLIIRNGKLAFENYFNGANRNTSMNIYSAEKSITSCLMGIAIDEGVVSSLSEPLYSFFPEYDSFSNWSKWKELITLKHLLTMTSGFELEGNDYTYWRWNIGPRDWIKFYLDLPVVFAPGSAMYYKSLCDRLAGHVVEREAKTPLPLYAEEHLFGPLGMSHHDWSSWDPVNNSMISSGLRLRAIDMAKIGQMYLAGGQWRGTQIVSTDWVTYSTTAYLNNYGYNWWVRTWATPAGDIDVYYAAGNGGNGIYVFEEMRLVVVFTGDYFVQPDVFDQQFDLLKYQIIPAMSALDSPVIGS